LRGAFSFFHFDEQQHQQPRLLILMAKTHPYTPSTVTIVGGGNSAHVLIPFLHETGHQVNLLSRRPADWNTERVVCEVQCGLTGNTTKIHEGKITKISDDPAVVVPDADVIVLCMPVHSYRESLTRLAPYINRGKKEVFVGTIYGQVRAGNVCFVS
jgi:prephenate dehydrogenase